MAVVIPIVTQFNGKGIQTALKSFKQLETASDKAKFVLKAGAAVGVAAFAAVGFAALQAGQMLGGFAKMASDDQTAQLKLAASIRGSIDATDDQIASVEKFIDVTQRAVGVADDELRPAYSRLIRSTKDFKKAQDLLRLALDLSAATGKPLQAVTEALGKAYDGSNTALGRLGLGYEKAELKGMKFADLQKDLEKRFGGTALKNAESYEGVMARFAITIDELKESLGAAVLPYMKKLAEYGIQIADAFGEKGVAGAFAELKFILDTLLYDEKGQLNQAGKSIQGLVDNVNKLAGVLNFIPNVLNALPNTLIAARGKDYSLGTVGMVPNLATTINPGSLRGIRGTNAGVNVTVQTGIGDPVSIGRQVVNAINAYERRNGGR